MYRPKIHHWSTGILIQASKWVDYGVQKSIFSSVACTKQVSLSL